MKTRWMTSLLAGLGGLMMLGGASALSSMPAAPQVLLHPNHLTAKPPGGGGGGAASSVGWAAASHMLRRSPTWSNGFQTNAA